MSSPEARLGAAGPGGGTQEGACSLVKSRGTVVYLGDVKTYMVCGSFFDLDPSKVTIKNKQTETFLRQLEKPEYELDTKGYNEICLFAKYNIEIVMMLKKKKVYQPTQIWPPTQKMLSLFKGTNVIQ